ncbi:MAG: hypothetical protein N4A31_06370 [Rickettsiales bacterium]|nr:hypothetical protein [Rickettsiales bacterium]
MNTTITDFDEINELINLVAFSNINNIKDLTIVSSPTIIYLDNNQRVILENLTPTDLTEDNFIFASGPTDQSNDDSANDINEAMIISLSIATPVLLVAAGYCVYAKMTNHWPFLSGEIEDKTVEVSSANPMQDNA